MKYLINYADLAFFRSRMLNSLTGIQAGFDAVIQYKRENIDDKFLTKNNSILSQRRGAGYWLWKPYFILKTLERLDDGDILFYADAGTEFVRSADPLFARIEKEPMGIAAFQLTGGHKEGEYTRKSVIEALGLDPAVVRTTDQIMASFVIARKCESSIKVVKKWLESCEDPDLILDKDRDPDEFPEFKDHRHDQSLWSLWTKKLNVPVYPDPTQWGVTHGQTQEDDVFIKHHRKRT